MGRYETQVDMQGLTRELNRCPGLPFGEIGTSGGYGSERAELVTAIENGNQYAADEMLIKLIGQSVDEEEQEFGIVREDAEARIVTKCIRNGWMTLRVR